MEFLKDDQCKIFETNARTQTLLVEKMHLLYPKVINEKKIKAARVEAALRNSVAQPNTDENILPIDYLEITRN